MSDFENNDVFGPTLAILAVTAAVGFFIYTYGNQAVIRTARLYPVEKSVPTIVPMQPQ
jgi:hypothetical protein